MSNVQLPFPITYWKMIGCHEFLSTLGFDVMGVGREEVTLRSGKNNLRQLLQCAVQALKDLFGKYDSGYTDSAAAVESFM